MCVILGTLAKAQAPNITHFFMVYPLEKKTWTSHMMTIPRKLIFFGSFVVHINSCTL